MPRYINKGGSHHISDTQVVAHGQAFDSEDKDLRKKFPNKFVLATDEEVTVVPAAKPTAAMPAPVVPEGEGDDNAPATDATDVTKDFPTAVKNELTVRKDKTGFWLLDDTDAVNEKALRTKKAVEAAIADYVK